MTTTPSKTEASESIAETDLVAEARTWAREFSDPAIALDPLIAVDVIGVYAAERGTPRDLALEKMAVLMFQDLVESDAVVEDVDLGHPLVRGLVAIYAHRDAGMLLRKRMGARTIRLMDAPDSDVTKRVQELADASDLAYSAQGVLDAFAQQLKQMVGHRAYTTGTTFVEQYMGAATGCQRALAVAAVFEARGLL